MKQKPPSKPVAEGLLSLQAVSRRTDLYVEILTDYVIEEVDEYEAAGDLVKQIARLEKFVIAEHTKATASLKAELAKHDALFIPVKKKLQTSKARLKGMIGTYLLAVRRKQAELAAAAVRAPVTATGATSAKGLLAQSREAAAKKVAGISGSVKMKWRVLDASLVPDKYMVRVVNPEMVQADVDAGVVEIPGIEIYEDMAVRVTPGAKS